MDSKTARIAALNDELRKNFAEGLAVMTPGIAALGAEAVARIVKTIAVRFPWALVRLLRATLNRIGILLSHRRECIHTPLARSRSYQTQ